VAVCLPCASWRRIFCGIIVEFGGIPSSISVLITMRLISLSTGDIGGVVCLEVEPVVVCWAVFSVVIVFSPYMVSQYMHMSLQATTHVWQMTSQPKLQTVWHAFWHDVSQAVWHPSWQVV
jgi:hypothetical protein